MVVQIQLFLKLAFKHYKSTKFTKLVFIFQPESPARRWRKNVGLAVIDGPLTILSKLTIIKGSWSWYKMLPQYHESSPELVSQRFLSGPGFAARRLDPLSVLSYGKRIVGFASFQMLQKLLKQL